MHAGMHGSRAPGHRARGPGMLQGHTVGPGVSGSRLQEGQRDGLDDCARWWWAWRNRFGSLRGWGLCSGLNGPPPSHQIYIHRKPQSMILFEKRVFADVIQVRIEMKSCCIRVGCRSDENAFIRNMHTKTSSQNHPETHRRRCGEGGGRDWSCRPGNHWGHGKLEDTRKDSPSGPLEGT